MVNPVFVLTADEVGAHAGDGAALTLLLDHEELEWAAHQARAHARLRGS